MKIVKSMLVLSFLVSSVYAGSVLDATGNERTHGPENPTY